MHGPVRPYRQATWNSRALMLHIRSHYLGGEAREESKGESPRGTGHVALALSGGRVCVCASLSGSCSLWVVRVVTLIPLGP